MAVEIKMTIEKDEILPAMDALLKACQDFRPAFREAEKHMIASIQENFEAEGRPQKWAPWKDPQAILRHRAYRSHPTPPRSDFASEEAWKKAKQRAKGRREKAVAKAKAMGTWGKILQDTRRLLMSVTGRSGDYVVKRDKFELVMGTRVKYAPVHQYGSPKKNIPARPFLLFQKEDITAIQDIFRRYLLSYFERGGRR
ncbi:phage virion morphogenesis protein [bacterium]|nr:phage virion morphogenesis protein [bacterium]